MGTCEGRREGGSMIPKHLQKKSAEQICHDMVDRIILEEALDGITMEKLGERYTSRLEALLLLAVKDALMNADGVNICNGDYGLMGSEAECRAITFLNQVLP